MARPAVEWPIPVYTLEVRDRVVASYRIAPRLLGPLVPSPLLPELHRRQALVTLTFAEARCLKSPGHAGPLVSEFHLAEVLTPVRWQGACRPALRGQLVLDLFTDRAAIARLLRTSLELEPRFARMSQGPEQATYGCRLDPTGRPGNRVWLPRPLVEAPWCDDSLFDQQESAEAALLHPECYFTPDGHGRAIWATPVHQYARATTHVAPTAEAAPVLAELLGARPEEVTLDHVFFQKRCTHTWSFPPERIPMAHPSRLGMRSLISRIAA